jgi:branched-subunit amino acid transport protein
MIPALALLAGVAVTYVMRIAFITLVPADRLPERVRDAMDDVGPAAMAAIIATHLAHGGSPAGSLAPTLIGVVVASAVAWRTGNLAATVATGIATVTLATSML